MRSQLKNRRGKCFLPHWDLNHGPLETNDLRFLISLFGNVCLNKMSKKYGIKSLFKRLQGNERMLVFQYEKIFAYHQNMLVVQYQKNIYI